MKGITVSLVVGIMALVGYGSASAFDLGGAAQNATKDAAHEGSKKVVESQINKNLAEKHCAFKPKTTDLTCDLNDILSTIKTQKTIAEKSGFSNNVVLNVDVGQGKDSKNPNLGGQRMDIVRNQLHKKISWWDWWDESVSGDDLKITVKVK
jgi:hypothetical protein